VNKLSELEAESIYILRETAASFEKPVLLYSIGKDSSVLLRLAQKAFHPASIPFSIMHIDTGFKFREMIEFRDTFLKRIGLEYLVSANREAIQKNTNPYELGVQKCCALLKTKALVDALKGGGFDAAIGGARREEEKSRAKEHIFSIRDRDGQWDPRRQRPEMWKLFHTQLIEGESMRVFPLSNWTELDVWRYIEREKIPVVPLYFAKKRPMILRTNLLIPADEKASALKDESIEYVMCRYRTLGCSPCTGAIRSDATTVSEIIRELESTETSERENRVIDHDREASMEAKKREGYF
jgi:sulfate adenylyltransferase subunit 2